MLSKWIRTLFLIAVCAQVPVAVGNDGDAFDAKPAKPTLVELIEKAKGKPAAIVSTLQEWKPRDRFRNSEETYQVRLFEPSEFAALLKLERPQELENEHFAVVENSGEEVLPVDDFDGANVLFHLMRARAYFLQLANGRGDENPALDRKIVVRVRVNHAYNLATHFAEIEDYNNARYIPRHFAGQWERELWFHERKALLQKMNWFGLTTVAGHSIISQDWMSAALLTPLQLMERFNAGLDGAKTPDVIYHEAFHWATDADGHFPMTSEGHPVAEDYANYFASSLNGRPMLAEIEEFTSRFYKRSFRKIKAIKDTSDLKYNATTFVPALFWEIRRILGQARADQLIWNSMRWLRGSFRHTQVLDSVMAAAIDDRDLGSEDVRRVRELFEKHATSFEKLERKFNASLTKPAQVSGEAAGPLSAAKEVGGFKEGLLKTGKTLGHLAIDGVEWVGHIGTGLSAVLQTPTAFGADLVTGLLFGSGVISDQEDHAGLQITGAVSGLSLTTAIISTLNAGAMAVLYPVNMSGLGASLVTGLVCRNADSKGSTEKDQYCSRSSKVTSVIIGGAASAGAKIGVKIHDGILTVAKWFRNLVLPKK